MEVEEEIKHYMQYLADEKKAEIIVLKGEQALPKSPTLIPSDQHGIRSVSEQIDMAEIDKGLVSSVILREFDSILHL